MSSIGDQLSLIKIVHKTPDDEGGFSTFAVMQNSQISWLSAALDSEKNGLIVLKSGARDAEIVYTNVEYMNSQNLYRIPDEGSPVGIRSVDFLDNVSRVVIIMTNIQLDPHGYVEKAN